MPLTYYADMCADACISISLRPRWRLCTRPGGKFLPCVQTAYALPALIVTYILIIIFL